MVQGNAETLVDAFTRKLPMLETFSKKMCTLVNELLESEGIRTHSVTERVKRPEKLREKIGRPSKHYEALSDITDQVGLRIITYYQDEVDSVADILRREFAIDEKNSIDKRLPEDPEKFTYSSLHFVCLLNQHRLSLGEYQKYSELKFEIQVRSILQHAWAEIEHDWYDLRDQLPAEIKRRFSRLAGLLDLADSEFLDIRKKKIEYERSVSLLLEADVPDLSSVLLDQISIRSFVLQEPIVADLDNEIARIRGFSVLQEGPEASNQHRGQLAMAEAAKIRTLQDLRLSLTKYRGALVEYVKRCKTIWDRYSKSTVVAPGVCIFNLSVMLIAQLGDDQAREILQRADIYVFPELNAQLRIAREVFKELC